MPNLSLAFVQAVSAILKDSSRKNFILKNFINHAHFFCIMLPPLYRQASLMQLLFENRLIAVMINVPPQSGINPIFENACIKVADFFANNNVAA